MKSISLSFFKRNTGKINIFLKKECKSQWLNAHVLLALHSSSTLKSLYFYDVCFSLHIMCMYIQGWK